MLGEVACAGGVGSVCRAGAADSAGGAVDVADVADVVGAGGRDVVHGADAVDVADVVDVVDTALGRTGNTTSGGSQNGCIIPSLPRNGRNLWVWSREYEDTRACWSPKSTRGELLTLVAAWQSRLLLAA